MKTIMIDLNDSFFISEDFDYIFKVLNYTNSSNITFELDNNTAPCQPIPVSDAINVAVCCFYVLVFLLALPGNLMVGVVTGRNWRSLSPSDVYLFHLMIADMLLALVLPFYATSLVRGWLFGDFLCKLVSLVKEANFYTSILFLVCISVERYMVIVRATKTRKAPGRLCSWAACGTIWGLGLFLSLPALYNESFSLRESEPHVCAERFDLENADEWRLATRIMRHVLGFLLPLAIMVTCYSITMARLLRARFTQREKAMKVIIAVVVAFLLCWTPFHMATMADTLLRAKLVNNSCEKRNAVDLAMFFTQSLALLHCCVNPVLYAFVGAKFKGRFTKMVHQSETVDRSIVSKPARNTSSSEATSNFF